MNTPLKEKILNLIDKFSGVSFAEIQQEFGDEVEGDRALYSKDNENIIFWNGLNEDALNAIMDLISEGQIKMTPTSVYIYLADGMALKLPVVSSKRKYKTPHWLPVVLNRRRDRP